MRQMKIFTIGFTKTSARSFFTKLSASGAKRLVDVRLNNVSQLAGFAKREDLRYFSEALETWSYVAPLKMHDLNIRPFACKVLGH